MTPDGEVPRGYGGEDPIAGLDAALEDGAGFVAVDAVDPRQAAQLVEAARERGAAVAVASPNGPKGTPNLTPFVFLRPGSGGGLLYSPTTRTEGLLTNADVAPTLLDALGAPVPPEMSGRAAEVRPGDVESAELLQRRLWLVEDKGFQVGAWWEFCGHSPWRWGQRRGRRGSPGPCSHWRRCQPGRCSPPPSRLRSAVRRRVDRALRRWDDGSPGGSPARSPGRSPG